MIKYAILPSYISFIDCNSNMAIWTNEDIIYEGILLLALLISLFIYLCLRYLFICAFDMINGAPPRNTSGAGPRAAATPLRHGNTIIPSPKPRNSFSATLKTLKTQRAARYSFVVECCCASIAIVARGALQELQARICFWIGSFFFESNVACCRLFPFAPRVDGPTEFAPCRLDLTNPRLSLANLWNHW